MSFKFLAHFYGLVKIPNMPSLTIKPAPLSKTSVIVLSWPCKANWDLLNSLNNGCYLSGQDAHQELETTAMLFSIAKEVEFKLGATALDVVRGKFADVRVDVQKGTAILTITTEPTFSAVRKVITVTSKAMTPAKMYPVYKKYIQNLGEKPDADHFAYVADDAAKNLKGMQVFVTGTVKVPEGGQKALKDVLDNIKPEGAKGKAPPKNSAKQDSVAKFEEISVGPRFDAFIGQQLLKSMKIESFVRDGNLVPVIGSAKLATVTGKVDAERIKRYVDQKVVKLGDKLPDAMRLMCALSGYFTAQELEKLPASYTAASLTASLKKVF